MCAVLLCVQFSWYAIRDYTDGHNGGKHRTILHHPLKKKFQLARVPLILEAHTMPGAKNSPKSTCIAVSAKLWHT